jgi:hypothetical protein
MSSGSAGTTVNGVPFCRRFGRKGGNSPSWPAVFFCYANNALTLARIIHEDFCCNRQLHAISSRARSLRFDVLQVRLQGNSLRLACSDAHLPVSQRSLMNNPG